MDVFWARYDHIVTSTIQCSNSSHLECIKQEQVKFNEILCVDGCPLECESTTYDLQASMLVFPSRQMYNILKRDMSSSNNNKNLPNLAARWACVLDLVCFMWLNLARFYFY